jgi:hypothetical protein
MPSVFLEHEVIAAVQSLTAGVPREASEAEIPNLFSNLAISLLRMCTQGHHCRDQ